MPSFYAAFDEKKRRRLALALAALTGICGFLSMPCCVYSLVLRSRFKSEAHYFMRHGYIVSTGEVTNAPFAVKAGFGFSAFVSIGFTVVLGLVASSFWYNADETRRLKRDAFDILMKVKFGILVLCAILAWSMYINMNFAKRHGRKIAVGGLTRAIMNYDKGQSANFPNDKYYLDKLHVMHDCCGIQGWRTFQQEQYYLKNITRQLSVHPQAGECGPYMFCYVPWSCCRKEVATCTHAIFQLSPESSLHAATLSDKGCVDALSADFVSGAETLMTIALIYILTFVVTCLGHRWFHTSCIMVFDYEMPFTPGWLLPCGGTSIEEMMTIFSRHIDNRVAKALAEKAAEEEEDDDDDEWEDDNEDEDGDEDDDKKSVAGESTMVSRSTTTSPKRK